MPISKKRKITAIMETTGERTNETSDPVLTEDVSKTQKDIIAGELEPSGLRESEVLDKDQERRERFKALQTRAVSNDFLYQSM